MRHTSWAFLLAALGFACRGGRLRSNISVIPSGLDTERIRQEIESMGDSSNADSSPPTILHVGRSAVEKNRSRAVSILAELLARGVRAELVIVGRITDEERAMLVALAQDLPDPDLLQIAGERHDLPSMLCSARALLLTSTREGLPGVVLEAVAAGTPVVASDLPGVTWVANAFPEIYSLSLDASDATWAMTLAHVLESAPRAKDRKRALG